MASSQFLFGFPSQYILAVYDPQLRRYMALALFSDYRSALKARNRLVDTQLGKKYALFVQLTRRIGSKGRVAYLDRHVRRKR